MSDNPNPPGAFPAGPAQPNPLRERLAESQEIANAVNAAALKEIQARATLWSMITALIAVFAVGLVIPIIIFCIRLAQLLWAWTP